MSGGPGAGIPSPYSGLLGSNQSGLGQSGLQAAQNWQPGQPLPAPTSSQQQAMLQAQQNWSGSIFANQTQPAAPLLKPDPKQPDTLGWREWKWSETDKRLKSPSQDTLWPEAELVVPNWDEGDAVRGTSGIHAHLVPKHWKILGNEHREYAHGPERVHGIVERFGKYVLGTEGWRAEWVVIKELMAPSTAIGLEIEKAYPDVIVHYPEEEGDESCTLEKSSKLGKGSRPTSRPKPSPIPSAAPSQASSPHGQMIQVSLQQNRLLQALQQKHLLLNASPPTPSQPSERPPKKRALNWLIEAGAYLTITVPFAWLVLCWLSP